MISTFIDLSEHLSQVEGVMREALASSTPRVQQLIDGLGRFHGKMLRPALVFAVAEAVGRVDPLHLRMAAALELIHTATLVHDDLIDDATTRRGVPTAHIRFGNTTAVLLGDYLYTHAFHLVSGSAPTWAMERLTGTTNIVCAGELHQQMAERDTALSVAEYEQIIYAKTAALTELSSELGALRGSDAQRSAASAYGRACGMAFQIVDDCLDIVGDAERVGKTLNTDLDRGRMTLPVLAALAAATAAQRDALSAAITAGDAAIVKRDVVALGGLDAARTAARAYVATATDALAPFPSGPARDRLASIAGFIVARDF